MLRKQNEGFVIKMGIQNQKMKQYYLYKLIQSAGGFFNQNGIKTGYQSYQQASIKMEEKLKIVQKNLGIKNWEENNMMKMD
ncbi:unnamed protein product [Paramecium sonneborni]|uniref:Uncharacterized protein n=1 Tax=Paramecium sonneborni TaxID=65129 RepID=A0A8S1PZ46_9CILI|nr:unnamed protein product [Paramecium sonneborni]